MRTRSCSKTPPPCSPGAPIRAFKALLCTIRKRLRAVKRIMIMEVCSMIKTLIKNWWLLAFCGVLDAMVSVVYFNHVGHGFHGLKAVVFLGEVTLASGIWSQKSQILASDAEWPWLQRTRTDLNFLERSACLQYYRAVDRRNGNQ